MDLQTITDRIGDLQKKLQRARQKREQLDFEIGNLEGDLSALERVASRNLLTPEAADDGDASGRAEHGELRKAVEQVIHTMMSDFNKGDVMTGLAAFFPEKTFDESSVSSALRRLSEGDGAPLVEVEKGQGRRMSKYRRLTAPREVAA